jgi:hypothetical protein
MESDKEFLTEPDSPGDGGNINNLNEEQKLPDPLRGTSKVTGLYR